MIIPVGHRVLVKPKEIETQTEGGIYIVTDEKLEKAAQQRGVLVAAGPQAWKAFRELYEGKEVNGNPWAKPGDTVIYSKYAGKFLKDEYTEEEFVLLNDEDIVALEVEGDNLKVEED